MRPIAAGIVGFLIGAGLWVGYGATAPDLVVQEHRRAQERHEANPEDAEAAWVYGRALFELAEHASNKAEREQLALRGLAALRPLVAREPRLAAARYYLALNLGQLARTRTLGALKLVSEMESAFLEAKKLDRSFDHAGPDRCLALLYRDAPGWPASIGSRAKARQHLEEATARHPDYPGNRLLLVECLWRWGDRKTAVEEARLYLKRLPSMREKFVGPQRELDWKEWDARWKRFTETAAGAGHGF